MKSLSKQPPFFPIIFGIVLLVCVSVGFNAIRTNRNPGLGSRIVTGETTTVSGRLTCLPKKTDGPTTLECAYGLKDDTGKYYALGGLSQSAQDTSMDTRVKVTGAYSSPATTEIYDITGSIQVKDFQKL